MSLLDTRFTAETPEGIALALRPAGIVSRFYASWNADRGGKPGVVAAALKAFFG